MKWQLITFPTSSQQGHYFITITTIRILKYVNTKRRFVQASFLSIKKVIQYSSHSCTYTRSQNSLSFEFGCSYNDSMHMELLWRQFVQASHYQETNAIFRRLMHTHALTKFEFGCSYNDSMYMELLCIDNSSKHSHYQETNAIFRQLMHTHTLTKFIII